MDAPIAWKPRTIHKFILFHFGVFGTDTNYVDLPAVHKMVHVAMVGRDLVGWFEVQVDDVSALNNTVEFIVVGTGRAIPTNAVHVATVLDGEFVWHLYRKER